MTSVNAELFHRQYDKPEPADDEPRCRCGATKKADCECPRIVEYERADGDEMFDWAVGHGWE